MAKTRINRHTIIKFFLRISGGSPSHLPIDNMTKCLENYFCANEGSSALECLYEIAIKGTQGIESAVELAESYMKVDGTRAEQADELIRSQSTKIGVCRFSAIFTLALSPGAHNANVVYLQVRMIAAIAYMGGYDLTEERVRSLVYLCLTGTAEPDMHKEVTPSVSEVTVKRTLKNVGKRTITIVNKWVRGKALTKLGESNLINLGKVVPFSDGIVGSVFDVISTNAIGNIAKDAFIDKSKIDATATFDNPEIPSVK